ncbi:hypothetical protein J6590_097966 [Homalodisca vitripennis]|nr:hypothetical protein J6590_088226 [Homalodisca vitripennis]KAG8319134.1 hypothetical protein J6590_097966 [Homalodisca vitripennis]
MDTHNDYKDGALTDDDEEPSGDGRRTTASPPTSGTVKSDGILPTTHTTTSPHKRNAKRVMCVKCELSVSKVYWKRHITTKKHLSSSINPRPPVPSRCDMESPSVSSDFPKTNSGESGPVPPKISRVVVREEKDMKDVAVDLSHSRIETQTSQQHPGGSPSVSTDLPKMHSGGQLWEEKDMKDVAVDLSHSRIETQTSQQHPGGSPSVSTDLPKMHSGGHLSGGESGPFPPTISSAVPETVESDSASAPARPCIDCGKQEERNAISSRPRLTVDTEAVNEGTPKTCQPILLTLLGLQTKQTSSLVATNSQNIHNGGHLSDGQPSASPPKITPVAEEGQRDTRKQEGLCAPSLQVKTKQRRAYFQPRERIENLSSQGNEKVCANRLLEEIVSLRSTMSKEIERRAVNSYNAYYETMAKLGDFCTEQLLNDVRTLEEYVKRMEAVEDLVKTLTFRTLQNDTHVLHELLNAMRILVRICEKQRLHKEAHALELSLELILRRRNYILNVSVPTGSAPPYDSFPCENCYMTYSSVFIMSWLDYLMNHARSSETSDGNAEEMGFESRLCRRSCSLYFDTSPRSDHLVEGVLYPMGVPYVSGPEGGPPYSANPRHLAFSENDELEYVHEASRRVLDTLSAVKDDGNGPIAPWAGIRLAESVTNLLSARRSFGFDMDCVDDAEVNRCRSQLSAVLESYGSEIIDEAFVCQFLGSGNRSLVT